MPYTGKVSNSGMAVDTNNDGIPDGRAMTLKNAGNFDTFSLTNGVLTIAGPTGGSAVGGSDTQVQFNDGGSALGGHGGLVYDKTFSTNAGKLTVANLVISGDLTVSGTTTTVNTTNVSLADNIIVLNSDATGSASADAGIEIERGDDANVQFLWDETNDQWDFDSFALGSVGKVYAAGSGAVYTFTSDTDTGVEHVGLNQLGLLAGNTRVLMVNANGVHIAPAGASGAGSNQALLVDNISIDTNTIASTNTNGNIVLVPNGSGDVQLDTDTVRVGDSGADATITTNGAGDLVLNTNAGTNSGSITIEDGANNDILIIPNGTGKVGVAQATPTTTFHVGGDVTIAGGLTVAGTTTTINSTNTQVADPIITLNEGETGGGVTGNIAGVEVDRGTQPIARFVWDDDIDHWRPQLQLSVGSATYNDTNFQAAGIVATSNVNCAGIIVDGEITHDGDLDTKISFLTDQVQLYAGNVNGIDITAGSVVINEGSADIDFRVESNGNANMLFVDGTNNRVGIGTNSPAYQFHSIITTANSYAAALQTDEDSQSFGPGLLLHRNSASPADADILGKITFGGRNDNSQDVAYANITTLATDVSDHSEDGSLLLTTIVGGTERQRITILPSEVVFNEDSIDSDFRVETDSDQETFFVQGSSNRIGISTTTPIATLDVDAGGTFRASRLLTTTITSSQALAETDYAGRYVFVTGTSIILTLGGEDAGVHYTLLSNDANGFTLRTGSGAGTGETMNGSQADISVSARDGVTCISDGTNWVVLGA